MSELGSRVGVGEDVEVLRFRLWFLCEVFCLVPVQAGPGSFLTGYYQLIYLSIYLKLEMNLNYGEFSRRIPAAMKSFLI